MNIFIAGDYCPCFRINDYINRGDYSSIFGNVKKWTTKAEYSIINLECPVTDGKEGGILKRGPLLCCNEKSIDALKWAGFDCVTLANNHFGDFGDTGVKKTLKTLTDKNIDYVGGGNSLSDASRVLYKQLGGDIVAIINCCEHEFSIALDNKGGANPMDPIKIFHEIKDAKDKADYVILIIHGGHEHYQLPSERMQSTYRFFIEVGADAVLNHHQHCFSGFEIYNGKPIFYGLGNFCFDEYPVLEGTPYNYGYAVMLSLSHHGIDYELFPYEQCGAKVGVFPVESKAFDEDIRRLNEIISNSKRLKEEEENYYRRSYKTTSAILSSNRNRWARVLLRLMAPSKLLGEDYLLRIHNLFICESHRDKAISFILSKYQEMSNKIGERNVGVCGRNNTIGLLLKALMGGGVN